MDFMMALETWKHWSLWTSFNQSRGATGVSCSTHSQMFAIQWFIHQKTCITNNTHFCV